MQYLTAPELATWLADTSRTKPVVLDVREPHEYEICHIDGAVLLPMNTISARLAELDKGAAIVCVCHHGARSMQVARLLEQNNFDNVSNLTGGVHAWARQVDQSMPTY